jgi:hypothetical protein
MTERGNESFLKNMWFQITNNDVHFKKHAKMRFYHSLNCVFKS